MVEWLEVGRILKSRVPEMPGGGGEFYRILKIIKRHIKYTNDNTFQDFEYILYFSCILLLKNQELSNNTVISLVFILTIHKARFI